MTQVQASHAVSFWKAAALAVAVAAASWALVWVLTYESTAERGCHERGGVWVVSDRRCAGPMP